MTKFILLVLILIPCSVSAVELEPSGLLNSLTLSFINSAADSAKPLKTAALRLFWILLPCSIVLVGVRNLFKDGSFNSFFKDLIMLVLTTGIFLYLLNNGTQIGQSIIDSMTSVIDSKYYGPSELVDLTFKISRTYNECISDNVFSPLTSMIMHLLLLLFMIVMFLVIIRFACMFLCAHLLCIVGIFVLGFGAYHHTRPIAVNYLKSVFSIALELMTMIIIAKAGCSILEELETKAYKYAENGQSIGFEECCILAFTSLFLYILSKQLPSMIGGLISSSTNRSDQPSGLRLYIPSFVRGGKKA